MSDKEKVEVFVSDVPKSNMFKLAMIRSDRDGLSKEYQKDAGRVCEAFQNCVCRVAITRRADGSSMRIHAMNLEDPKSKNLMWSQMHYLISDRGKSVVEIFNFACDGDIMSQEKYDVSNVVCTMVRSSSSPDPQTIVVDCEIDREYAPATSE